jgi:4-aminobutyrate aminotransferase
MGSRHGQIRRAGKSQRGRRFPAGRDGAGSVDAAALTDRILEELKDRGVILGKNGLGRNVLAFQPPLVINRGDIDFLVENLEDILRRFYTP